MLSWVMGNADLSIWPQAALVIFMAVYVAAGGRMLGRSAPAELERAARLPLNDEEEKHNHV